jgi:hypothetical protein
MEKKNYNIDNNNDYYSIDFDFNKIKKTIVNYVVIVFGIIIVLIFTLLILYYLTPNNYEIFTIDDSKFKLKEEIEFSIKPDSITKIDNIDIISTYLKFPTETNLVIKNIFKSQNIYINNNNELVKPKYNSEIFLINNSNLEKKIIICYYLLKQ